MHINRNIFAISKSFVALVVAMCVLFFANIGIVKAQKNLPAVYDLLLFENQVVSERLNLKRRPFGKLKLVDEIDTSRIQPRSQSPENISQVKTILGKQSRFITPLESASYMTYRIGKNKDLKPHQPYVLEFEYPEDSSRSMFVANRGADFIRGFATGNAIGDSRAQYAPVTLESIDYPLSNKWEIYHQLFYMHERTSTSAQREHQCADRSVPLSQGFDVTFFQSRKYNDPRSAGIAVAKIRLYEVIEPNKLAVPISYPENAPKRHVFLREEMADEAISSNVVERRATTSVPKWYEFKMDMGRALGFNTVGKDLMEFGFNQGFDGEDGKWINNSPPPRSNIWKDIVHSAAERGLSLMPYFEYGGSVGPAPSSSTPGSIDSLGLQRRTEKLFHGIDGPGDQKHHYTPVWWTENISADLTDPDTFTDFKRVLDRSVLKYKNVADFAGIWIRTRPAKLPISFSDDALARYNQNNPSNLRTIAQLRNNPVMRESYYRWWFNQRKKFLERMRSHIRQGLDNGNQEQVLFTPYSTEPAPKSYESPDRADIQFVKLITDDNNWWSNYVSSLNNNNSPIARRYRFLWNRLSPDQALENKSFEEGTLRRQKMILGSNGVRTEWFHGVPPADPDNYQNVDGVSMTYSFDNGLHTVASAPFLQRFSNASGGQSLIHHYTLNEDNGRSFRLNSRRDCNPNSQWDVEFADPFDGLVGYLSSAVERSGPYSVIAEARALANGNPVNIGYLESSSMSRGFPAYVRRFNQALLSLPAVSANDESGIASLPNVSVKRYRVGNQHYFAVINPNFRQIKDVTIDFSGYGMPFDLLKKQKYTKTSLTFGLYPGEVRTFRVNVH